MRVWNGLLGLIGIVIILQLFTIQILLFRYAREQSPNETKGMGEAVDLRRHMPKKGEIEPTGGPLDFAIAGHGFFQVMLPDGKTAYTRHGGFRLDRNGTLVTSDGYPIQPAVTLPSSWVQIICSRQGTVEVTLPGSNDLCDVGTLQLARFVNPEGLEPWGMSGLLLETAESGTPAEGLPGEDGLGIVEQGCLGE